MAKNFYVPSTSSYGQSGSGDKPSTSSKNNFFIPSTKSYSTSSTAKVDALKQQTTTTPQESGFDITKVPGALWEGLTSSYKRVGEGLGEIVANVTGVREQERKQYEKSQAESQQMLLSAIKKSKETTDPAKKKQWEDIANNLSASMKKQSEQFQGLQSEIINKADAAKNTAALASIGLDIATLGTGASAVKAGMSGAKVLGKTVATGAAQGAASGALGAIETGGKDTTWQDLAVGAGIGTALGGALPVAGKVISKGKQAVNTATAKAATGLLEGGATNKALQQVGQKGVFGALDKAVSNTGKKIAYGVSDLMSKTKVGSKIIDMKDDFMSKWVSNLDPLYRTLKRSDFEGKTTGAYLAAREAIGNSNRALSYAQSFMENDPANIAIKESLASRGGDILKHTENFDEYSKLTSEINLLKADKKEFSPKKVAELEDRLSKVGDYSKEFKSQVQAYKNLNDFRLKEGLISQEEYNDFANSGFDYVRQQRELPEWMLDKPGGRAGGKAGGSVASISSSSAIQKRNKYASAELLSPRETYIKTAQLAHVEAYRNRAAKTIFGLLNEAGEAKLVKSTDMVREKQALITAMKESKPIVNKMNRTLRTEKKQLRRLESAINQLNKEGLYQALKTGGKESMQNVNIKGVGGRTPTGKYVGKSDVVKTGKSDTRSIVKSLVTEDPSKLKQIRKMLESRDAKLSPLMDTIEVLNRDLQDLYAMRSGMYNQAQSIKLTGHKGPSKSPMSFMEDGVENIVKVDPAIEAAVKGFDEQSQNVMNEFLRMTNNVFKLGTTGLNVGFALPNFVSDQISSGINSKAMAKTHNPVNFVRSLFMTIGHPLTEKDAQIMEDFVKANKGAVSINQYTKKATSKKIANEMVMAGQTNKPLSQMNIPDFLKGVNRSAHNLYTYVRNPVTGGQKLMKSVEDLIGVTENLTRVQNFRGIQQQAIKEGLDPADAVRLANQAARENSVDFLESGSYGKVVNGFIPYFNAGIQGTRTLARNFSENPVSFAAKTTALIGMPVALSTAWNTSDPERKKIYNTIPEYIKENNFVVITPQAKWNEGKKKWDGVIIMKKPPGYKEFAEPTRKFIEYVAENDPEKAQGLMGFLQNEGANAGLDAVEQISPIDFSDPYKFLSSVTPQILKPTAEAITGKNFYTGSDIVPDSLKELPNAEQKYKNYSQLTSHIASIFDTSPLKVDQWIKQTFGEVGTMGVNTADRLMGAPKEATGGRSMQESVERRFSGTPGGADKEAWFKTYTPAKSRQTAVSKEVTSLIKQNRLNEAKRKVQEYNDSIAGLFKDYYKKYKTNPTEDTMWDDMLKGLYIADTNKALKARAK